MNGVFIFVAMNGITTLLISALLAAVLPANPPAYKAPAGTVTVPGVRNVFLDKVEVTNIAWREYLYFQKQEYGADSEEFLSAIPDTAIWKLSYDVPFFGPNRYDDWPITGISYRQAQSYCQWRSMVVSQKEKREVTYSLPSMKIYKLSARDVSPNKIAEGLYSTTIGFRTFLGLCENADEMTDVEGVAIMGSKRVNCLDTMSYFIPTPSLSFRCMAEIH